MEACVADDKSTAVDHDLCRGQRSFYQADNLTVHASHGTAGNLLTHCTAKRERSCRSSASLELIHDELSSQTTLKRLLSREHQLLLPDGDALAKATLRCWRGTVTQCVSQRSSLPRLGSSAVASKTVVAIEGQALFSRLCRQALNSYRISSASPDLVRALIATSCPTHGRGLLERESPAGVFVGTAGGGAWKDDEEECLAFDCRVGGIRVACTLLERGLASLKLKRSGIGALGEATPTPNCAVVTLHAGPPSRVEATRVIVTLGALPAHELLFVHPLSIISASDPEAFYAHLYPAAADRLNIVPRRSQFRGAGGSSEIDSGTVPTDISTHARVNADCLVDCGDACPETTRRNTQTALDALLARGEVEFSEYSDQGETDSSDTEKGTSECFDPYFLKLMRGAVRVPTRPRRVGHVATSAAARLWPWRRGERYFYGVGENTASVAPSVPLQSNVCKEGDTAYFEGLYFPDSLLTMREEPELGSNQVGVVATERIPFGTAFVYGGQLVEYVDASSRVIARAARTADGNMPMPFADGDRTYEFGISATVSILGGNVARCVNHRYNVAAFGNVQFLTVTLPTDVHTKPTAGGTLGRRVRGPGPKKRTNDAAPIVSACNTVPVFLCSSDVVKGESVTATSYGEGYDAKLEREVCCGGRAFTGHEAFALRTLAPTAPAQHLSVGSCCLHRFCEADRTAPITRQDQLFESTRALQMGVRWSPVSPMYSADYRYGIDRGSVVAMRRWFVGTDPGEAELWDLMERSIPDLSAAAFIPSTAPPGHAEMYAVYLFVVRSSSPPRDTRSGGSILKDCVSDWLLLLQPLPLHNGPPAVSGDRANTRKSRHRITSKGAQADQCVMCGALDVTVLDDLEYDVDPSAAYITVHDSWHIAAARAAAEFIRRHMPSVLRCDATSHGNPGAWLCEHLRRDPSRIAPLCGAAWPRIVGPLPTENCDF
jgi:hypothetical protein